MTTLILSLLALAVAVCAVIIAADERRRLKEYERQAVLREWRER